MPKRKKKITNITPYLFASEFETKQRKLLIKLFNSWPGSDEQKIRNIDTIEHSHERMVIFLIVFAKTQNRTLASNFEKKWQHFYDPFFGGPKKKDLGNKRFSPFKVRAGQFLDSGS